MGHRQPLAARLVAICLIGLAWEGCKGTDSITPPPPPVSVARVDVGPSAASVPVTQTVQLSATPRDAAQNPLTNRTVTWASLNGAIASVNASGLVTGVAPGTASITATSEGVAGTATITVVPIPVATVAVTPATSSLPVGQTAQLTATASDASGNALSGRSITWTSSASAVATVSTTGVVTAVNEGSATITATAEGKSGTAQITVTGRPVASVIITPQIANVLVGQTSQFTAAVRDASGTTLTGRTVSWTTSNTAIATISASGLLTAVAPGSVIVTATSEGVSAQATANITAATPTTTIVVTNQLIDDVVISANGTILGTVPAGTTRQSTVTVTSLTVTYDLIRTKTTSGVSVGDQMSGIYQKIDNPSGTITFVVNNKLGTDYYFAPLITNNTASTLLMAVNWGLAAENRCNCTVPPFGSRVHFGYYRYYSNTEIRGYSASNGYGVGTYVYWRAADFQNLVAPGSGAVDLTSNIVVGRHPTAGSFGMPGIASRIWTAVDPSPSRNGPVYDHAMPRPVP